MDRTVIRKREPHARAAGTTRQYRIADYPMHYFAAIQRQNQLNLARVLRARDLSVPAWRVLSALSQKDGQTVGQIAALTVLDRSGLGRLLEQMGADGLVERTNPPQDRRAVLIRLTPRGRSCFAAALPLVETHYRRLLRGIASQDFKALIRLLRRIKANALMMADASDLEPE
jgi:MarR family transcriptional regulator, organic hydroperoxide resistance regulator